MWRSGAQNFFSPETKLISSSISADGAKPKIFPVGDSISPSFVKNNTNSALCQQRHRHSIASTQNSFTSYQPNFVSPTLRLTELQSDFEFIDDTTQHCPSGNRERTTSSTRRDQPYQSRTWQIHAHCSLQEYFISFPLGTIACAKHTSAFPSGVTTHLNAAPRL